MTLRSKIQKLIDTNQGIQDALDDLVHEQAQTMASRVNNEGLKAQLEFLEQQCDVDDEQLLQYLKEAADG
jgi:hypothetical protein